MGKGSDKGVVLVAEDDDEDFQLAERAFKKAHFSKKIARVKDGQDLIDYLLRRGKYTDPNKSPRPELVLLDLNMPIKNGREALQEIKSDEGLKDIPVVVLTTSRSEEDVVRTYKLGVNSFIRKPFRQKEFVAMVRTLSQYWFNIVELPPLEKREIP